MSPSDKLSTVDNPAVLRGNQLYILTTKDSPNGSVLVFDLDHPENPPNTAIAPSDNVIDGIYGAKDALYISSRNGVMKSLSRLAFEVGATPEMIGLPVEGSTFSIAASTDHSGILFGLQSWIVPPIVYRYDPVTNSLVDTKIQPKNPLDLSRFQVREVQTTSTDGAVVPMSIICGKESSWMGRIRRSSRVTEHMGFLLTLHLIRRFCRVFWLGWNEAACLPSLTSGEAANTVNVGISLGRKLRNSTPSTT